MYSNDPKPLCFTVQESDDPKPTAKSSEDLLKEGEKKKFAKGHVNPRIKSIVHFLTINLKT